MPASTPKWVKKYDQEGNEIVDVPIKAKRRIVRKDDLIAKPKLNSMDKLQSEYLTDVNDMVALEEKLKEQIEQMQGDLLAVQQQISQRKKQLNEDRIKLLDAQYK